MAESKHRRKAKRLPIPRIIRAGDATVTFAPEGSAEGTADGLQRPSEDEIRDTLASIPEDLNWDWARSRLVPLFERGYGEGQTGDPLINTVTSLGVGVGFGIDLELMLARVSRSMAQRWEASVEQIEHAAFAHLAEVAAGVTPRDLQPVVHHGHFFRALGEPGGWASSMILAGEAELTRIYGAGDQIFIAPARNTLLAFGIGTPGRAIGEITLDLESLDPHPLQIDPFVMEGGELRWEGLTALDDVM